ncbi:hypothetical protein SCLCIDRAFT_1214283 [Scleroderma citrinum Foug A]|uniref:Amino acid transporter transmembrane domain-containing protein n=1 Tax=Scleroderma citrinum Foug A TaxID=1036808 RepID=A0A0C3DRX0_9AGAM|nr:hypothetical protein SCLCIDRAFT_1214283 [Scleroderma citrinum Foug A]
MTASPRLSVDVDSSSSNSDSPISPQSPVGLSEDAAATLVLLPDTEAQNPYDLDSDDDIDDERDPQLDIQRLNIPPLPASVVFLYLLSPYLKLGALYISDGAASLWHGLITLILAASLSAFCRHLWFMLGRYLRKVTLDDILIEAFIRGRGRGCNHSLSRAIISGVIVLFRILLAAFYMRDSVYSLLPLVPEAIQYHPRLYISALLGFVVLALSLSNTLAAKPVIYSSGLSLVSYVAWLIAVSHAYATGMLQPSADLPQRGILWNEYSSIVFACSTSLTVPLSASLASTLMAHPTKDHRKRLFKLLNVSSTTLGMLLILPLVIFTSIHTDLGSSKSVSDILVPIFRAGALVLSIPSIIVSTPSLRFPHILYRYYVNPSRLFTIFCVVSLSLVSPSVTCTLRDVTLLLACSGTFLLPALTHITIHYFRRPLAIIIPQASRSVPGTPRSSGVGSSSRPSLDPLLQRKERALQRRRLGRRLMWDIGIWLLLIPACASTLVWTVGRIARKW